jgi:hypothetical protein
MVDSAVRRHMGALRATADARAERLRRAREKERQHRARERREKEAGGAFGSRKRSRPDGVQKKEKEAERRMEDLLPEDAEGSQKEDDGLHLSAEVRALMARLHAEESKEEEEPDEDVPKVSCRRRTPS